MQFDAFREKWKIEVCEMRQVTPDSPTFFFFFFLYIYVNVGP